MPAAFTGVRYLWVCYVSMGVLLYEYVRGLCSSVLFLLAFFARYGYRMRSLCLHDVQLLLCLAAHAFTNAPQMQMPMRTGCALKSNLGESARDKITCL